MFTGIVEEIGDIASLSRSTSGMSLTIALSPSSTFLSDAHLGDSISVNGVCLTITDIATPPASFTTGLAPETLRLTNLESTAQGSSPVNLERAVRADTRMGGHFVQGHVDCTARIIKIEADGEALTMRFAPLPVTATAGGSHGGQTTVDVMRHIVRKGFIALDGTSLTITAVDDEEGWWEVMLVAYTQEKVVLAQKAVDDLVNVEVDVMAKYAEKAVAGYLETEKGGEGLMPMLEKMVAKIVRDNQARGKV